MLATTSGSCLPLVTSFSPAMVGRVWEQPQRNPVPAMETLRGREEGRKEEAGNEHPTAQAKVSVQKFPRRVGAGLPAAARGDGDAGQGTLCPQNLALWGLSVLCPG